MLEFACHTWAFTDLTLPEALGTIARLGFRYVDIGSGSNVNANRAAENPRRAAADIRADLEQFNLKVSDLYILLPRISVADEPRRTRELELFKALLPFAVELGAPGITVSPGLAHPAADTAAYDRAVDALRTMAAAARTLGLRLSIEPHLDSMASTPEMALKFLGDVPDLSLTLDWAHFACQGIPHEQIAALLPKARHLHLRQAAPDKLQTPFEMGTIDFRRVLADAVAAGYDGKVCIEYMNTPGWHGMVAVNAARESARLRDTLRDLRNGLQAKA
jgi:sugar phosphate isomerase/epimerase